MTTGRRICSLMVLVFVALVASAATAAPLMAGKAVADITPDTEAIPTPLGGYGARQNAPAEGVHDSILSKALVLEQDGRKCVLVTLDLLGIPRSLRDEVLVRVADAGFTSDNLMLTASHSHAATEMAAMNRKNVFNNKAIGIFDERLLTFTADRIAQSIREADKPRIEVRAGSASTKLSGMNRNRRGDELVDDDLTILRLDTMDGVPFAALVNFTAHPTLVSEKTMHVSAEWPGYMQREIETFVGDGLMCMYANGAEGDISPAGAQGPSEFARAEDYGRKIAVAALKLLETIETHPEPPLEFSTHTLDLPPRTVPPALLDAAGIEYGLTPESLEVVLEALAPDTSYLGLVRVGDWLGVGIPGEMTSGLGIQIKDALRTTDVAHPVILGLANEWISYILPADEYHQGGYEPGVSFYGDQLGPRIVEQAIARGKELK